MKNNRPSASVRALLGSVPLLGLAAGPGWAADVDAGVLEEVVITALRAPKPVTAIPNSVRVIERETIDTQLAVSANLQEALGFLVPSYTGGTQKMSSMGESMRGRTPLYMVDGIPQSTPLRDGKRSAMTIDPDFIERVEVVYGANAIQGMGATGGIINYVTVQAPKSGEWSAQTALSMTSDGFHDDGTGYKLTARAGKRTGNFDFVLGGAYESRGLYYDAHERPVGMTVQGDTQDSKSWNLFTKAGYDIAEDQRLELLANQFELKGNGERIVLPGDPANGIPTSSIPGDDPGLPPTNDVGNFALTYRHEALAGGTLSVQTFHYTFESIYGGCACAAFQDASLATPGLLFDQSSNHSEKLGVKTTYARDIGVVPGLELVAGIDWLRDKTWQDLKQTGRVWVPKTTFKGYAPFLQLEQTLLDERLRLSGGMRYEDAELDIPAYQTLAFYGSTQVQGGTARQSEVLENLGVVIEPRPGLSLFLSYSEGFTMPDVGRVLRDVRQPGQSAGRLTNMQPVLADNLEAGVTYSRSGLDLSASYFWSDSDFGQRNVVVNGIGFLTRQKTHIEGVELAASLTLPSQVVVGANYARLNGRFDSNQDNILETDLGGSNISPDRVNLYVQAPLFDRLAARVQMSHFFDREFRGVNPDPAFEGYSLVDATLAYDMSSTGKVTLSVHNLLDEFYISYYGQVVSGGDPADYFAGRGRAVTLRYQLSF